MVEMTDEEFEAATERGRIEFETKPHARLATYDRLTGMIRLELYNGCTFAVPARQLQGLGAATDDQLAEMEILGVGTGLHWESLDADFTVAGLMEGRFGTARYMAPFKARLRAILEQELSQQHDQAAE